MPNADDQVVDGFGVNPFSDENLKRLEAHYSYRSDCDAHIICLAVEEINRLRAEVERLKNHANAVCHAGHTANIELREENHKLQSEVERLKAENTYAWDFIDRQCDKLAAYEEAMPPPEDIRDWLKWVDGCVMMFILHQGEQQPDPRLVAVSEWVQSCAEGK